MPEDESLVSPRTLRGSFHAAIGDRLAALDDSSPNHAFGEVT